jgi:hypothetical protein
MENYREFELERQNKRLKIILVSAGLFLLISLAANVFLIGKNNKATRTQNLLTERLDSLEVLQKTSEKELENQTRRNLELLERNNLNQQEISNLHEMVSQKNSRIAYLSKFQSEVADLRKKLRDQDSLNNEIVKLSNEKVLRSNELHDLRDSFQKLDKEHSELRSQAEVAAPLKAYNVCVHHSKVNRRGKERPFLIARRINQTLVSFEVPDNPFTKPGSKDIHLVLTGPDGKILLGEQNFTPVGSTEESAFTDSKSIDYKGLRAIYTFTVKYEDRPVPGTYTAAIFIEGVLSGKKEFRLN